MGNMNLLVMGAGYSGLRVCREAQAVAQVVGTRRTDAGCRQLASEGISAIEFNNSQLSDSLLAAVQNCTHLLVSMGPDSSLDNADPALAALMLLLKQGLPKLAWIGYFSTIGVYGDHHGRWVDESAPCTSKQPRTQLRIAVEQAWQSLGAEIQVPVAILRLSGIYGPGRNALCNIDAGRARLIIKPDQVFNRIHVNDLAVASVKAMLCKANGIINISDRCPAPPQDVVLFAHQLMSVEPPAPIAFEHAQLSAVAQAFYSENKRVDIKRSCEWLNMRYLYPDYQSGLSALWESGQWNDAFA